MHLKMPSGAVVEITHPVEDFPLLILAAESRRQEANEDIKFLKAKAKQLMKWPVAETAKEQS